jgi:hypothetical protein
MNPTNGELRMENSPDPLNSVGINVHQLVGFQQSFNLRPDAGEQSVELVPSEIAESQMDHPQRW